MKRCSQKRALLPLQLVRDLMNAVLTLLKRRRKNYLFAVTHFIHTYTSKKYPQKRSFYRIYEWSSFKFDERLNTVQVYCHPLDKLLSRVFYAQEYGIIRRSSDCKRRIHYSFDWENERCRTKLLTRFSPRNSPNKMHHVCMCTFNLDKNNPVTQTSISAIVLALKWCVRAFVVSYVQSTTFSLLSIIALGRYDDGD